MRSSKRGWAEVQQDGGRQDGRHRSVFRIFTSGFPLILQNLWFIASFLGFAQSVYHAIQTLVFAGLRLGHCFACTTVYIVTSCCSGFWHGPPSGIRT